jgi:hemolysin III
VNIESLFPVYSRAERVADAVVHIVGVPLGLFAAALLLRRTWPHGVVDSIVVAVYAAGLVGMLAASAAYQLSPPGLLKERLRRLDRAMIFVMIAGTYTPISTTVLYGRFGLTLCLSLWCLAAIGIFLTLRYPRRFERVAMALYLLMGWMLLVLIRYCFFLLAPAAFALIVAGGIAYTIGAVVQGMRVKFHNPLWHVLVLLAAALQYAAISLQLTGFFF